MKRLAARRIFVASLSLAGVAAQGCGTTAATNPASGGGTHGGSAGAAGVAGVAGALAGAANAAISPAGAGTTMGGNGGSSETGGRLAGAPAASGGGGTSAAGASTAGETAGGPAMAGGGEGGSSACGGLLCEDFESGLLDASKWDTQTLGGTVTLESDKVAHGKYALRLHGQPSSSVQSDYAFIIAHNGPAALATHHFGRAYFFITPKPTSGHTGMVFAGTPGFPKPAYLEVANINSGWQLGFVKLNGPPNGEEVAYPPGQVPVEKWSCLEWEFNDQPDAMTLWVDGAELGQFNDQTIGYPPGHVPGSPIFNGNSSDLVGGFSDFGFGFYDWHPKNAFDLYYDDLVLDTKRVGCLPATP